MTPRKRNKKWRHLPDHLEPNTCLLVDGSEVTYYRYQMPDGTREPLGKDEAMAVDVATELNNKFYGANNLFSKVISGYELKQEDPRNPSVHTAVDQFEKEWVPLQDWAANTLKTRLMKLNQYRNYWEGMLIKELGTFEFSEYLKNLTRESKRQNQFLLKQFGAFCCEKGYFKVNPMLSMTRVKAGRRQRKRHTYEGYKAIYDVSPPYLQNAMGTALYSLQRRTDLVSLLRKKVSLKQRTIEIYQGKTDHYDNPVFLEITMGDELFEHVRSCILDNQFCPTLLSYSPKNSVPKYDSHGDRLHSHSLTPDYLTKAFAKYRNLSGAYDHLEPNQRPSLHDLRALGIFLYFKAGYPIEYIQALAGHATIKMTQHYKDGHEKPLPVKVSAGLSIDTLDLSGIDWDNTIEALPRQLKHLSEEK